VTETGFKQEFRIYECLDCSTCTNKSECTKSKENRTISFNKPLWRLKQIARKNLLSEKGLEMRSKRAEYSEGIFGQLKWNMGFKRFLLRGLDKVGIEISLLLFSLNIKRMHKKDIEKIKNFMIVTAIKSFRCFINIFKQQKIQFFRTGFFAFSFLF